jgi:hypothetical protein
MLLQQLSNIIFSSSLIQILRYLSLMISNNFMLQRVI